MIVYLEMPDDDYRKFKKYYPIRRSELNGKLYFDTQTPYFGRYMNTGVPFQLQDYVVSKACWDNVMFDVNNKMEKLNI